MAGQIKPGGVGFYCDGVNTTEVHSSKCNHCGSFTEFPSLRRMFDHVDICRGCMKLICLGCVGRPCLSILKKIEIEEAMARRRAYERL